MSDSQPLLQAAPNAPCCCSASGRLCALARRPVDSARLIAVAVHNGNGSREEVEARILDLLACGLLIEVERPESHGY